MELDAFTSRLGLGQGRLLLDVMEGRPAFVLGESEPGRLFELIRGDHAQVVQETDLCGVDFVRTKLVLSVPQSLPSDFAWEASLIVDGHKLARARARTGQQRTLVDLAANVSKQTGLHEVGVRLELVED
jgi:hypothetical protein